MERATNAHPESLRAPRALLYSINARIGGYGLDVDALEALRLAHERNFLGKAVAYDNRQDIIPASKIRSLRFSPVRLLSFLDSPFYYDAKKKYLDRVCACMLRSWKYDFFHGWAGNSLHSLREAKRLGIPSVLDIPTWHRDKGKIKPRDLNEPSRHERNARFPETLFKGVIVKRQESLEEYDLADVLLVRSECAARSFEVVGFPPEKLFRIGVGADISVFKPRQQDDLPASFSAERPLRAVYCGALIKRKGVHILLEAWHKAALPHATLTLFGAVHEEIRPFLEKYSSPSIRAAGFVKRVQDAFNQGDLHIFPSECEGSAKVVCEACASGLPQITTRESSDVVRDGFNGFIVPCNNADALAEALKKAYSNPLQLREFGKNARDLAERELSWDALRERLAQAYDLAIRRARKRN